MLIHKSQSLDVSIVFKLCLVLRAINVPSIKKYPFLKRKFFVTVSNHGIMAKTADVPVKGQTANWNQSVEPL